MGKRGGNVLEYRQFCEAEARKYLTLIGKIPWKLEHGMQKTVASSFPMTVSQAISIQFGHHFP